MILSAGAVDADELARKTGWTLKSEGLCRENVCVPVPTGSELTPELLSERLCMPLVRDDKHGLIVLGPESGGRVLTTATAPDFTLPERGGSDYSLSSARGRKVLLLAWASW